MLKAIKFGSSVKADIMISHRVLRTDANEAGN